MQKCLILDFNRTLYDPDSKCIMDGAMDLLYWLRTNNWSIHLLSKGNQERRILVHSLGIESFFDSIKMVSEKSEADFIPFLDTDSALVVSLGDRGQKEIDISASLGLKTIWFQSGKFKNEFPQNKPDAVISKLSEAPLILEQFEK